MNQGALPELKAIDLFAGCGGLTLGLKQAGFDVVAAVEVNSKAAATYRENHPTTQIFLQDIRKLDPQKTRKALGLKRGELALLAGCPPCQGFSRLKTKNGARPNSDLQNGLIHDFSNFVREFRPKCLMLENVPQLESTPEFETFKNDIRALGYADRFDVIDVADHGVAQRRKRFIYIASRVGLIDLAPPLTKRLTVRDCIGHLPKAGDSRDQLHDMPEYRSERVKAIMALLPPDGGSRRDLPSSMQLACHKKINGFADVYGRMAWDRVAPTITSGCNNPSKGRFVHPEECRAITLREAAMLQGFPEAYKFLITHGKESIALMIGNALPPPFIHRHAAMIHAHLTIPNSFTGSGAH